MKRNPIIFPEGRKVWKKRYREKHKESLADYARNYRLNSRETYVAAQKKYQKKHIIEVNEKIISNYGGKCVCCGETNPKFLTLDHMNNDGSTTRPNKRAGYPFYEWVIKNGFPPTLRLLCWNCNCGRQRNNGVCPHQDNKSELLYKSDSGFQFVEVKNELWS